MSNVNLRLFDELFVKKTPPCRPNLYQKYYGRIWPCERDFKSFLRAESSESQIELAKRIVSRLGFMSNFPIPKFLFLNLLEAEHIGDDRAESGYIAQDHVVHSVSLYILGIYLYFSHEAFHARLTHYFQGKRPPVSPFETPLDCSVKAFLTSWRVFCLSHDLGYVLERAADSSGHIKESSGISPALLLSYNSLWDECVYDLVVRSLARCLYADWLFRDSRQEAASPPETLWQNEQGWFRMSGAEQVPLRPEDWTAAKQAFQGCAKLPFTNSYLGLKHVLPFLRPGSILTVVKDPEFRTAALHFSVSGQTVVYFKKGLPFLPEELMALDHLGSEEFPTRGYFCDYFIPSDASIDSGFEGASFSYYPAQLKAVAKQLRLLLGRHLSLAADDRDSESCIYEIYQWLRKTMPLCALNPHNAGSCSSAAESKREAQEFRSEFLKLVQEKIQSIRLSPDAGFSAWHKELSKTLSEQINSRDFSDTLMNRVTRMANEDPFESSRTILRTYLRNMVIKITNSMPGCEELVQIEAEQIALSNPSCGEARASLEAGLQEKAAALHISYPELSQYHGPYSYYDHGAVSARLVSEVYLFFQALCGKVSEYPILSHAWPVMREALEREVMKKDDILFTEAIFSVLLHNVYTPTADTPGIKYCQDLTVNPFSYFCAFCDNLQLWDRPKLIHPAHSSLPDDRFPGNDFDLTVEGSKIHLYCQTNDIHAFLTRKRDSLGAYLRDAPALISVTVSG